MQGGPALIKISLLVLLHDLTEPQSNNLSPAKKQRSTTITLINPVYFQLKHPNNNIITTNSILNDGEVNILLVNNVSTIYHYNVMNKQQLDQMACTIKHMSVVPTDSTGHINSKRVTNVCSNFFHLLFLL